MARDAQVKRLTIIMPNKWVDEVRYGEVKRLDRIVQVTVLVVAVVGLVTLPMLFGKPQEDQTPLAEVTSTPTMTPTGVAYPLPGVVEGIYNREEVAYPLSGTPSPTMIADSPMPIPSPCPFR